MNKRSLAVVAITVACVLSLAVCAYAAGLSATPHQISPNGDGVRDELLITLDSSPGDKVTVQVVAPNGEVVSTLAQDLDLDLRNMQLEWDGSGSTGPVADGTYTIKASFKGSETVTVTAKVIVDKSHKWAPLEYSAKPFFPIGVWFEGSPAKADSPAAPEAARTYYDRCFRDLAAHGFNTVAVPNCPENLWDTLLKSAQANGISVILEIGALVDLVGDRPITEAEVYTAAKKAVDKLSKYPALLRYQIRDEPWPSAVPNWLLVQRVLGSLDPSRPAFSCFCSVDSLASVTSATKLSEACYDIYPLGPDAPAQTLGGFVPALDAFVTASAGNVMWPVLQSFAKPGSWRYPTPEELRSMTYLSLAAGAKGIFDFIYQTMPTHPEKLEGLVDVAGNPTPLYGPASAIAKELKQLAPLLLSLKTAAWQPTVEANARARAFTGSGKQVLIVASTRPDSGVTVSLGLSKDASWKDAISGEVFTSKAKVLDVSLPAGGGRVLTQQ